MAALQCEICGGKLMARAGGIFECDSCGMQYDKTRIQELVQEIKGTVKVEGTVQVAGTVKVEGPVKVDGPVQVDGVSTLDNHIKRGNMALAERRWKDAILAFDIALGADVECAEAYLGKYLANRKISSRDSLSIQWSTENYRRHIYSPPNSFERNDVQRIRKYAKGELAQWFADCDAKVKAEDAAAKKAEEARQVKLATNASNLKPMRDKIQKLQGRILSVSVSHAVGLRSDGTVVATGQNTYGQCNVTDWFDIVAVSASGNHTVGLRSDGTVIATGNNEHGQCDVEYWTDIVAISSNWEHTVGLKRDGTVVATGRNDEKQCNLWDWKNIAAIATGMYFTLGLQADGKIVTAGNYYWSPQAVKDWHDIIDIAASGHDAAGLRANGSTTGSSKWTDIVAIAQLSGAVLGLNINGCVDLSRPSGGIDSLWQWKDIVTIAAGSKCVLAVCRDGTVLAKGENRYGQCNVSDWKLFDSFDNYEQESVQKRRQAAQRRLQAQQEVLNRELAGLKGLFTGKRKKEIEARLAQIEKELSALR